MKSPVLLLAFNRPDTTRQIFEAIRAAKPSVLFLGVDGPRADRPDDVALRDEVLAIVGEVDWPCEVHTKFEPENLGCKRAVAEAIGWMLEAVGEGIILEDDTLPCPAFFEYCDVMLDRYRDDPSVQVVSGYNPVVGLTKTDEPYMFSNLPMIWGWATWQRVWRDYDVALSDWNRGDTACFPPVVAQSRQASRFWADRFSSIQDGTVDTWDYQLVHAVWKSDGRVVLPAESLVINLGFREDATHTSTAPPRHVRETVLGNFDAASRHIGGPAEHESASLRLDKKLQERFFALGVIPAIRGMSRRVLRR